MRFAKEHIDAAGDAPKRLSSRRARAAQPEHCGLCWRLTISRDLLKTDGHATKIGPLVLEPFASPRA